MENHSLTNQNKKPNDIVLFYSVNNIMWKGLKTHSWAKKRFKITKSGKILFKKACNNHLLTNKWNNNKRDKYGKEISPTYVKKIKALFPHN